MDGPGDELVARASTGDAGAVGELLVKELPRLRGFVHLRMGAGLRAREESTDLVSSICREILEHEERFAHRGEENFRRWLFTTAIRLIRNKAKFWQRERRAAAHEEGLDGGSADGRGADYGSLITPSRDASAREQLQRLDRAFAELPDDYREVIALSRVLGLSHKELAEQCGRSELAMRSLLHRALAALAEALGPTSPPAT